MKRLAIYPLAIFAALFIFSAGSVFADVDELMNMSLEELLNVKITSASGREQKQGDVSNTMYVITSEMIARSGAKNLPDLFYRVPGMQVRKLDGHRYEVAIRDAPSILTANLLVLLDGAVVFNPGLSGTFWQYLPVALDDIERIEIIRGPGGVLYSSNAVRGVINIFTKSAKEQDNYVSLRGGNMKYGQSNLGFSQKSQDGKVSVGGSYQYRADEGLRRRERMTALNNDLNSHIESLNSMIELSDATSLKLTAHHSDNKIVDQGEVSAGGANKLYGGTTSFIAEINHQFNEGHDLSFHLDQTEHRISLRSPSDVEAYATNARVQDNVKYEFMGDHTLSFGGEWKFAQYHTADDYAFNPDDTQKTISFFVQNEYQPTDKWIIAGALRSDDNNYVYPREVLLSPRASIQYNLTEYSNIRAVATRAYRTNSFLNKQGNVPYGTTPIRVVGDVSAEPEEDTTYELGYRTTLLDNRLNIRTDLFYSKLKDAIILTDLTGLTAMLVNNGDVITRGAEAVVRYTLNDRWDVNFDYSYIQPESDPMAINASTRAKVVGVSKHLIGGGVQYTRKQFTFDAYVKYIDSFNSVSTVTTDVFLEDYITTFMRLAYKFKLPETFNGNDAEVELVANDIFDPQDFATRNKVYIRPDLFFGFKTWF